MNGTFIILKWVINVWLVAEIDLEQTSKKEVRDILDKDVEMRPNIYFGDHVKCF